MTDMMVVHVVDAAGHEPSRLPDAGGGCQTAATANGLGAEGARQRCEDCERPAAGGGRRATGGEDAVHNARCDNAQGTMPKARRTRRTGTRQGTIAQAHDTQGTLDNAGAEQEPG